MISRISIAFLMVFCASMIQAQNPNFYIFLCFGQSNMEGQGTIASSDNTVDERFQVFQAVNCDHLNREKGAWYTAVPPLTRCWSRLSPADYFGRTMIENLPDHIQVGVLNVSVGGCRLELFDKDLYQDYTDTYTDDWFQNIITAYEGNPYQYLINLAQEAQHDGVIKGILLHQGESNNGDSQWPEKVKKIYNDLITDLELDASKTPLLAGEMVHEDQGGLLAGMNTIINQLPEVLDNSYIISSSGCSDQDDNVHFDATGYRELGRRYAQKMLEVMDQTVTVLGASSSLPSIEFIQITPNPIHKRAQVMFHTTEKTDITVTLLNVAGKQIQTLVQGEYLPGSHETSFDCSQHPAGIYFCEIATANGQVRQRLVIR